MVNCSLCGTRKIGKLRHTFKIVVAGKLRFICQLCIDEVRNKLII
jgi:hypothetical protein